MIDHLSLGVSDLARAGAFYDALLATLGCVRLFTHERAIGYGLSGARDEAFAILAGGERAKPPGEGGPGPRPEYGPGYYAAFVRDLDGHRLEAVCHEEQAAGEPKTG
jgi:hypothetical protein